MFDVSFVLPCDDRSDYIEQTIKQIAVLIKYSKKVEIVVVNSSVSAGINSCLNNLEQLYPDNLLLVNIENETDPESYLQAGLQYIESRSYLYIDNPIQYLSPDIFDKLIICQDYCDADSFKYIKDKYKYIILGLDKPAFQFNQDNEMPMIFEYRTNAGSVDLHYFFQDIYVANLVFKYGIKHIYDIGSRIDGYISHLLSMDIHVTMIDIRPLPYEISNLDFIEGNATDLSELESGSIPALSCLHALEHFGLGRYGDPLDYDAWRKALNIFKRIVSLNGYLFLSVPIGVKETVVFNAHRIFDPMTILSNLLPTFSLLDFTLIHEGVRTTFDLSHDGNLTLNMLDSFFSDIRSSYLGNCDCGIFILKKF